MDFYFRGIYLLIPNHAHYTSIQLKKAWHEYFSMTSLPIWYRPRLTYMHSLHSRQKLGWWYTSFQIIDFIIFHPLCSSTYSFPFPPPGSQSKYSSNHCTACKNAFSFANFWILTLVSQRTLNPWLTPEYRLIWYGCLVSWRMVSDLWRLSAGKISSVSAAAMDHGPLIAASSASSTNLWDVRLDWAWGYSG